MSTEEDARVFGQHFAGGWELGLLVARNVHKRAGAGKPPKSEQVRNKVSCAQFAKMAGVSDRTVQMYCTAWALAAEAGYCTPADQLSPGVGDPKLAGIDLHSHEFAELWRKCYREARPQRVRGDSGQTSSSHRNGGAASGHSKGGEGPLGGTESSRPTEGDPKLHPLYGLQLAVNRLADECRSGHSGAIVSAAREVATRQHRAALARATGAK